MARLKNIDAKLLLALILLVFIFCLGVFIFWNFFDYNFVDAIYMTLITITTIGFGEVKPLTPEEKIYISVFIVVSLTIVGYGIAILSEYLLNKSNIGNFRYRLMQKNIKNLENHVIVCGHGRNGNEAVKKLKAYGEKFVIIDKDKNALGPLKDTGVYYIEGDATEDEVLVAAGIKKASVMLCTLPSDADNVFIVLSAKQLNEDLRVISRATKETTTTKLKMAGAEHIIMPDKIGGDHMASLVVTPDLIEFLDHLSVSRQEGLINIEEIPFAKISPQGKEQAIKDLDLRKHTGCTVIGYRSPEGDYMVNPDADMVLSKDSKLIFIGKPAQIDDLKATYNS